MPEPRLKSIASREKKPETGGSLESKRKKELEREKELFRKYPVVADLEWPMERIIRKKGGFNYLSADIIIGDDASGRLPALLYLEICRLERNKLLEDAKKKDSQDENTTKWFSVNPEALFAAGFRGQTENNALKQRIQKLEDEIYEIFKRQQERISGYPTIKIVTDYIDTGEALDSIVEATKRAVKRAGGYSEDIEIITMGIRDASKHIQFEKKWNLNLIGGTLYLPDAYKKYQFSGVVRTDPSKVHAEKIKPVSGTQRTINETREAIKLVAKRCWEQALAWKKEELESIKNNTPWFQPQHNDYSHNWPVSSIKKD